MVSTWAGFPKHCGAQLAWIAVVHVRPKQVHGLHILSQPLVLAERQWAKVDILLRRIGLAEEVTDSSFDRAVEAEVVVVPPLLGALLFS
ncbi:hypothetical protein D3C75_1186600 [compost metagenome]